MRKDNKNFSSFTLVEMLVVVAVVGILASALLVSLGGSRAKARDARRISDLREVQNALELYYDREEKYPEVDHRGTRDSWGELKTELEDAGITSHIPDDPLNDDEYFYVYANCGTGGTNNGNQEYMLRARLEKYSFVLSNDIDNGDTYCSQNSPTLDCGNPDDSDRYYCVHF